MLSITSKHKHQCPNQPANACVAAQHSPSGLPGGFLLMEAGAGHAPPSPPPMPSTVPAPTDPFNWGLSLARSPRPHCVPWMPSRGLGTAGEAGLPGGNISTHVCVVGAAWVGRGWARSCSACRVARQEPPRPIPTSPSGPLEGPWEVAKVGCCPNFPFWSFGKGRI